MRGLRLREAANLLKVTQLVSGRARFEQSFLIFSSPNSVIFGNVIALPACGGGWYREKRASSWLVALLQGESLV